MKDSEPRRTPGGVDGLQPREKTLQGALPLARVIDHPDTVGQLRQLLARGSNDDDGTAHPTSHHAACTS